tara:strand:+ start:293 stop:496 length:204 start_codon:yes stop_codon:yes gene_type:complete
MNDSELKKILFEKVVEILDEPEFKNFLLKELNEDIDIPFLNEKQEGKMFKAIYKIIHKTLENKMLSK